jgi:hypothetical protein
VLHDEHGGREIGREGFDDDVEGLDATRRGANRHDIELRGSALRGPGSTLVGHGKLYVAPEFKNGAIILGVALSSVKDARRARVLPER